MARFNLAFAALCFAVASPIAAGKELRVRKTLDTSSRRLHDICYDPGLDLRIDENVLKVLATIPMGDAVLRGLDQFETQGVTLGSTTALIPEASDAAVTNATVEDGMSGDIDFPHGDIKPIATVGERSVCEESFGAKITGTPDGLGAYLPNNDTIRVVVQSEGYGPLRIESYAFPVNNETVRFGGSHIQYIDYDREMFSSFMNSDQPASSMVTGMGEMVEFVINLKGEMVGNRKGESETRVGAHFSNTDANGTYAMLRMVENADWFFQSLCSAHLEQKHQWGEGIGLEDDIFLTNEEWSHFQLDKEFVGLSGHALDIQSKTLYALGALTNGGFEKIVEINPQSEQYVMLGVSGYNGAFDNDDLIPDETLIPQNVLDLRNMEYAPRADGQNYSWPKDIVPYRIYVGIKGMLEDGTAVPEDDFLARNGLKYGQLYGFAIDMRNMTDAVGPTAGVFRDEWHKSAMNGDMVPGAWIPQPWRWDGVVRNFQHDGSWDYQNPPPMTGPGEEMEGYMWWNSKGLDEGGCKTEHLTPDPRADTTAFIQGSTCGYFGHLYVNNVVETLAAADGEFPSFFDGTYYVYQGETDITAQVELNGKGQYLNERNATMNWDDASGEGKVTFEDIDGLEVFEANGNLYLMIQEDSGNVLGERMFITSALEHDDDGEDLTYYYVAMSGGEENTRQKAGVGVPAGVACFDGEKYVADAHEFSGLFDLSGLLRKNADGSFAMSASDTGVAKHMNQAQVDINDKYILVGLQSSNYACGVIGAFQADRGGQWLVYQPSIDVPKAEEPLTDAPEVEEPLNDAPDTQKPATAAAETDAPEVEEPLTEAPEVEEPLTEAPEVEELLTDGPEVEEPLTDAPEVTDGPEVEDPLSDAPEVEDPLSDAPEEEEPLTDAPEEEEPLTEAPEVEEPVNATEISRADPDGLD